MRLDRRRRADKKKNDFDRRIDHGDDDRDLRHDDCADLLKRAADRTCAVGGSLGCGCGSVMPLSVTVHCCMVVRRLLMRSVPLRGVLSMARRHWRRERREAMTGVEAGDERWQRRRHKTEPDRDAAQAFTKKASLRASNAHRSL
jgi:hypothetical protein